MVIILIVIVVLTFVNGFFAASEMALVSVKPNDLYRLKEEGNKNALLLEKVTSDSTKYLSTIQVAITFAGFLSSAFAGSQLSTYLVDFLSDMNIVISNGIAVVIITVLLSFFTLVFGELVPKRIALNGSLKLALFCAPVINVVMIIFNPFVWLLSKSTEGVLRLLRIKSEDNDDITEKDIKEMIVYGHIQGLYKKEEVSMLKRIFAFDDLTADMIMTPINQVVHIDLDDLDEKLIEEVIESQFSRIPVFSGPHDSISGVLLIKDLLLELRHKDLYDIDVKSLVRKPFIIKGSHRINKLLNQMRQNSYHIAFVVDEDFKTLGIVTLEDTIEEIVGNITDEHDEQEQNVLRYIINGDMLVKDLEDKLDLDIDTEYITIHDFLKGKLNRVRRYDVFKIKEGYLKVNRIKNGEIIEVELVLEEK